MRISNILPALALASTVSAWSDYENAVRCGKKSPDMNKAIEWFCNKGDITVPSLFAKRGYARNGAHVAISGNCKPPQWVPKQYCMTQFSKLCANSPGGYGHQRYGRNKCQGWHLDRK